MSKRLKIVLTTVLALLLCVSSLAFVVRIFNESKTQYVSNNDFIIGGIDQKGEFFDTNTKLVSKDLIECQGLKIKLRASHDVKYRIFWYDQDGNFTFSTDLIASSFYGKVPMNMRYCRVVVVPNDTVEINVLNKYHYSRQLDVRTHKKQHFDYVEWFVRENSTGKYTSDGYEVIRSADAEKIPLIIDTSAIKAVRFVNTNIGIAKYMTEVYENGEKIGTFEVSINSTHKVKTYENGNFDYVFDFSDWSFNDSVRRIVKAYFNLKAITETPKIEIVSYR